MGSGENRERERGGGCKDRPMTVREDVIEMRGNNVSEAYLSFLTCISKPNFFSSVLTSRMFRKRFRPCWEFSQSSEWTPGRGRMVWARLDGAAVSNTGPSGGGLTCLPTYHSLMPIDKWVVRCTGCGWGEAAGKESGTAHHVQIQILSHCCWGSICKEVWGEEGVWLVYVGVHGNIYIKKSIASLKSWLPGL